MSMISSIASRIRQAGQGRPTGRAGQAETPDTRPPATWNLTVDDHDDLHLHGVALAPLTHTHGSPLHVVDGQALDQRADDALAPFADGNGIDVFSSYKTNPIPAVLDRLHRRGIGAEAISAYEMWLAVELGVPPERIIYNGPAKSEESLRTAAEIGVGLVNANSLYDLTRLDDAASAVGTPMRAGIRVSMPHMWGGQFGIDSQAPELVEAIRHATASPHLELLGLHVHSGFGLRTASDYQRHLDAIVDCCDRMYEQTGWSPHIIDLGGSLACASDLNGPDERVLQIADASTMARATLHSAAETRGRALPEIVCEPCRALTADTQLLLTTVLDVRGAGNATEAVLDIGVELAEPLASGHHRLFVAGRSNRPAPAPVNHRLLGPHATRRDVLVESIALAPLEPGDVLAVMDTGAYFVPFSTAVSHPRPAVVLVDAPSDTAADDAVTVIRRRETVEHRRTLDSR